ncbi:class I adenylate-forming enzyme family protein [Qipengyuania psychrotolerans]|uniref:AMP-binding protein n=1 Tax=Qipengyuania psychrotolerans TaxID=2867238 RepID=A0ABX8ZL32_9SPHN|nr:AMP-binding protein [Qipengyuania psychrotolerans]QZD87903.1 AMP-binding protein [Qipengyuania psychrotolerans]
MYDVHLAESHFPAQTDLDLRETTVSSILRFAAQKWPDEIALHEVDEAGTDGRTWTYAQLLADCEKLADALLTRFRPGERLVVWSPNIPEWILCEYAFGIAGLVLVTGNPGYQERELAYVTEQSGAVGLFIVESFRGNPMGEIARRVAEQNEAVREVVNLQDHDALFAKGSQSNQRPEVTPQDIAQIQYTSGSTGFPKGVLLHHYGLTNNSRHAFERIGMEEKMTGLLVAPLFHTTGCAVTVLGACQSGARLVVPPMFDPNLANLLVEREKVQSIIGVPTMYMMMLEVDDANPRDLTSIEVVGAGGSMVAPELIRRMKDRFGCKFTNGYGMTETSPLLTGTRDSDPMEKQTETIGQPFAQLDVSIRDPQSNAVMPLNTVGEICARGYSVMAGYNDNPQATADAIDENGWMHTGDLGRMDAQGFITITGRVKEMIIRGGENLYPVEIENALLEHPEVAQVAVVGLPDEKWGEIVAAFIRMPEGSTMDPQAMKGHCRSLLAAQKTPSVWVQVSEYPMTGSGKVQKFHLRDAYLAGKYEAATP